MMENVVEQSGMSVAENVPCPYFEDGRVASIEYLFAADAGVEMFNQLLAAGYRRVGGVFYRNVCEGCSSCMPLRVDLQRFTPSKSQRRTLRINTDIRVNCVAPAFVSDAKVDLYRGYLLSKHGEKDRRGCDFEEHLAHIHFGYAHTIEMDYILGDRIVGVGIVDEASAGLSSNYFYYDTALPGRRLGVFSILQEIRLARHMGKHYHYLGFCIEETPKMSYKKFFRPNQVLTADGWRDYLT